MGTPIKAPLVAQKLQQVDARKILRGMTLGKPKGGMKGDPLELGPSIKELRPEGAGPDGVSLFEAVRAGEFAMDAQGDVGLTISLKEVLVHDNHDASFPNGPGEIYIVTSAIDGSGAQPDFKTALFEDIRDGARLPLGGGGMLVGIVKNPRWFIDVHTVVMESDSDIRKVGQAIEKARKDSGLTDLLDSIGKLAAFDPTRVTQVLSTVDLFLAVLSGILQQNSDDHVATIHDFYLKSQAFGAGRHPGTGVQRFQDVSAAYQIDLEKL
jgi:hypothetical protein